MLHMLFRMLPVSLLVCLLLRMLFRTLLVVYAPLRSAQSNCPPDDLSLPACLLLHMLFRMLPVSPLVCLLLHTLLRMLNQLLFLIFSIRKDLIMPFCYFLIFLFVVIFVARL
jgi:hypothetical protein